MTVRPWQQKPRIVLGPDSPLWVDSDGQVVFVVWRGLTGWVMTGPGVSLVTDSRADANRAAVDAADRHNEQYPGKASAVTVDDQGV